MDQYQIGDCVGRGAYGAVYRAFDNKNFRTVAIKQLRIDLEDPADALEAAQKEIDVLKTFSHPNIVKYYGHYRTESDLNIVLEYCESGSLQNTIRKFGKIPERQARIYIYQLLLALSYLHDKEIIHRDVKADNLLSTKDGILKLSDFGTSRVYDGSSTMAGSPYWVAPEVITMNGATTASDIWSLGCTTIQLVSGEAPYQNQNVASALFQMVNNECPPLPNDVSEELKSFLKACFVKDVSNRATAKNLLNHPWIHQCISSNLPKAIADNISKYNSSCEQEEASPESSQTLPPKSADYNNKSFIFPDSNDDNWEDDFVDLDNLSRRLEKSSVYDTKNSSGTVTKNLLVSQSTFDLKKMINAKSLQVRNSGSNTLLNRIKPSRSLCGTMSRSGYDMRASRSHNYRKSLAECLYESKTLLADSSEHERIESYQDRRGAYSKNNAPTLGNNQDHFYNLILKLVKKMKYFDEFESCLDTLKVYLKSNKGNSIDSHIAILSSIVVEFFERVSQNLDLLSKLVKLVLLILKNCSYAVHNFCMNGILPHLFNILDSNNPDIHSLKMDCIYFIMCLLSGPDLDPVHLFMSAGGPDRVFGNIAVIAKRLEAGSIDPNTVTLFFAHLNVCHLILSTKILSDIPTFIPLYRKALTYDISTCLSLAINHYLYWIQSGQQSNRQTEFLSFAMVHVSVIFYTLSAIYSSNLYELSFLSISTVKAVKSILPALDQDSNKYITMSLEKLQAASILY